MTFRSLRIGLSIGCFLCSLHVLAGFDPHAELRAIVSGDTKGVKQRLSAKLNEPEVQRDTLLWARTLEMLGEQYFRISDIDEAKRYWDQALELRIAAFGEDSPEAGVGLGWLARYHNYMAAPQWDHQATAEEISEQAAELIGAEGRIIPFEEILVLRERAYAYKVYHGRYSSNLGDQSPADPSNAARGLFRKALAIAKNVKDPIWIAQILHDIGNTFTDQAIPSRRDTVKLNMVVDSALWYYHRSIALMEQCGLGVSEPVMMDHLTIGLLQEYAFMEAGYIPAIGSYRQALRVLFNMQKLPPSADLYQFQPEIPNKAQVLELFSFISHSYDRLWLADKESSYIDSAIHVIEAAVPYWEALVKEYDSQKLHLVTSSYAHSPFQYAKMFHLDRYLHSGESEDLLKAIIHMERRRNVKIQRDRLLRGLPSLPILEDPIQLSELIAPEGTLIIEYLIGHGLFAIVIGQDGPELVDLRPAMYNSEYGVARFEEFPVNEVSADRERFRYGAFEWYQRLLEPVLQDRKEKKLVIVPYGTLSHLSFGALLTDTVDHTDRYLAQEYEIRIAPDLRSALQPTLSIDREAAIAVTDRPGTSDLPFAWNYARTLAEKFGTKVDTALSVFTLDGLLRSNGILHIASHAHAEGLPDTEPFLLLNDGEWSEDHIPWGAVDRELIVLASCASGSGRVFLGEGAQSLGNALLQAGANAVVHTLWPVDDRSTNEILHHMYAAMLDGRPASTALHMAQKRFIEEHKEDGLDDPFYWSGIVLGGTDVVIKKDRSAISVITVVAALLAIGYILYSRSRSSRARSLN